MQKAIWSSIGQALEGVRQLRPSSSRCYSTTLHLRKCTERSGYLSDSFSLLLSKYTQGHVDMVTEKNNDVDHDFFKDAIRLRREDDWIKVTALLLAHFP